MAQLANNPPPYVPRSHVEPPCAMFSDMLASSLIQSHVLVPGKALKDGLSEGTRRNS